MNAYLPGSRSCVAVLVPVVLCSAFGRAQSAGVRNDPQVAQLQQGTPPDIPPYKAPMSIKDGKQCVGLFAQVDGGPELQIKEKGRGEKKRVVVYSNGKEVHQYPGPAVVGIYLTPSCPELPRVFPPGMVGPPAWPELANHLQFRFYWYLPNEDRERSLKEVGVGQSRSENANDHRIWPETGLPDRQRRFTVPAEGLPLETPLVIKVFAEDKQLSAFTLRLASPIPKPIQEPEKKQAKE